MTFNALLSEVEELLKSRGFELIEKGPNFRDFKDKKGCFAKFFICEGSSWYNEEKGQEAPKTRKKRAK